MPAFVADMQEFIGSVGTIDPAIAHKHFPDAGQTVEATKRVRRGASEITGRFLFFFLFSSWKSNRTTFHGIFEAIFF